MGYIGVPRHPLQLALGCFALTFFLCGRSSASPPVLRVQGDDEETAYKRDPAWKPAFAKVGVIKLGRELPVNNFCLARDGKLLLCMGGERVEYSVDSKTQKTVAKTVKAKAELRIYSQAGKRLATWPMPFRPEAIAVAPEGDIYVGGLGRICRLNAQGKVLANVALPKPPGTTLRAGADSEQSVTGIAVTPADVFVASLSPSEYSYEVHRLTHTLKRTKKIVTGLSGCCGQMDIQAFKGRLWVAHNGRHKVEEYDRNGTKRSAFGHEDRKAADSFGGCCEPKNIRFASTGFVYTAESGPPTVVKKFNLKGDFLGVMAIPDFQTGCVRVTVEVSRDNRRLFVLDSDGNEIHVFANARSNVVARNR